jgi:hypothetical protein
VIVGYEFPGDDEASGEGSEDGTVASSKGLTASGQLQSQSNGNSRATASRAAASGATASQASGTSTPDGAASSVASRDVTTGDAIAQHEGTAPHEGRGCKRLRAEEERADEAEGSRALQDAGPLRVRRRIDQVRCALPRCGCAEYYFYY